MILDIGSVNKRRRYNVTSALISWAHAHNDPDLGTQNIVMEYTLYMDSDTLHA